MVGGLIWTGSKSRPRPEGGSRAGSGRATAEVAAPRRNAEVEKRMVLVGFWSLSAILESEAGRQGTLASKAVGNSRVYIKDIFCTTSNSLLLVCCALYPL